jgi:hypothetical protein
MKTEETDSVGAVLTKIVLAVILMAAAILIANVTSAELTPGHTPSPSAEKGLRLGD